MLLINIRNIFIETLAGSIIRKIEETEEVNEFVGKIISAREKEKKAKQKARQKAKCEKDGGTFRAKSGLCMMPKKDRHKNKYSRQTTKDLDAGGRTVRGDKAREKAKLARMNRR